MRSLSLFCFFLAFLLTSCVTQQTITNNYLQNQNDTTGVDSSDMVSSIIQKEDLLYIRVYSKAHGVRPDVDAPYNISEQTGGSTANDPSSGFLVDRDGDIEYPQIGLMHVAGLTKEQLADTIKQKLEGKLSDPSVVVRFMNYRVTVLGEVGGPSTFNIQTEHINILEALGMAGDITTYGRKDNVKVIREVNGKREIGTIDLTSKDMFRSPYYLLRQNDVVLVEQTRRKLKQQDQQAVVQQIGLFTSIVAAAALILNIIK